MSSRVAVLICIPPSSKKSSLAPHLFSAFGVSVLNFGCSDRCVVVSIIICISLMTYDVEHIFICLFAMSVFSLVRDLFRSFAHFFNWVVFLLLSLFDLNIEVN